MTNTKGNSLQLNRESPEWLPIEITEKYNKTDLTYDFCLKLFGQLEAVKREKFPIETMRQWFIEFVRRGWTRQMLQKRYDALLSTKIFGIEKLDFADWVNAVEVYALDEVQVMVNNKVNALIVRGNMLKDKKIELTEEEKREIDLAIAKETELKYKSGWFEARETYQEERRRLFEERFK